MRTKILFIHALSPLHPGTGQSFGPIDLAVARDKATNHPYLPGTGLKGSLRAKAFSMAEDSGDSPQSEGEMTREIATAIFGPKVDEVDDPGQHAGTLTFGDGRLLLLPVRSVRGTFAWVTSPYILSFFTRDAEDAGIEGIPDIFHGLSEGECLLPSATDLSLNLNGANKVVFEDLDLNIVQRPEAEDWADFLASLIFPGGKNDFWKKFFKRRFCVVHDDILSFFSLHGTDVVTRNVLDDESKTVENLWDEENLPGETILYSLLLATPNKGAIARWEGLNPKSIFQKVEALCQDHVQFGGNATVGRGRCRLVFAGGEK